MRRSGLAVAAAVMLSMVPVAPPALAMPLSFNPAVVTSDNGSVVEISHRRKYQKCGVTPGGWRCGPRVRHHNHHRHHFHRHHHHGGACIRFQGIKLCFN
jgi:hypothetical protein